MRRFILIPHIKIHNANAMSSPYTIGFPAMTAWLGAVHALQRHVHDIAEKDSTKVRFKKVCFKSVAISSHQCDLQTYKGPGDFVYSIVGTANPLDKDGRRPAFIEEARCDLDVSLLIEYEGLDSNDYEEFKHILNAKILCMKFAGGDVLPTSKAGVSNSSMEMLHVNEDEDESLKKLVSKLMLGYVLIERRELMTKAMQNENKDALDALLDYLKVTHCANQIENDVTWTTTRKTSGWLVPIAVGFQGISDLGIAKNQRDIETPHRFAESMITLGEFIMPHRILNLNDLDKILWQYHVDAENKLYLCQTLSTLKTFGE